MLIAIDYGHNCPPDIGAVGCGKQEDKLTKELGYKLAEELVKRGHQTKFVCPPSAASVNASLLARANYANKMRADIYISLHFNAFSSETANGTEVWIYSSKSKAKNQANAVLNNMVNLGYKRRGVKIGSFVVLRLTNMPAILVECCFITNQKDVDNYSVNDFALAIANGVLGGEPINLAKEKIVTENIELVVEEDTWLKIETTKQSTDIVDETQLILIKKGSYDALLVGEEEGHYLVKCVDGFDKEQEYFIYSGHCKILA